MTKILECNDLNPGCAFVARGETEQDILQHAAEHAKTAHGVSEISEELVAKVRASIRDA